MQMRNTVEQVSLDAAPSRCTPSPLHLSHICTHITHITLRSDVENLFINSHWHGEYVWQVLLKSLH